MKGSFFIAQINELIEDFRLNQEVRGRAKKYIDIGIYRLNRWQEYTFTKKQ